VRGELLKIFPSLLFPLTLRGNKMREIGGDEGEIFSGVTLPSLSFNIPKQGEWVFNILDSPPLPFSSLLSIQTDCNSHG